MIVSLKRQIYILEYLLHSIPDLLLEDTWPRLQIHPSTV